MITGALLVLVALSSTPPPGPYSVVSDRIDIVRTVWPLFCDEALKRIPKQMAPGTKLNVVVEGAEWTASGAKLTFGTKNCQGSIGGLAIVKRGRKGEEIILSCQSRRVTQGTEKATQVVKGLSSGRVEVKTTVERYIRKQGDDCRMTMTRVTTASFAGAKKTAEVKEKPVRVEKDPCETPGTPTTLKVSPKVFDVKVGNRSRCLVVSATDKNGCRVKPTGVTFAMDPPDRGSVTTKGCVNALESLAETEAVAIVVRMQGLEAVSTARLIPKAIARPTKTYSALAKTTRSEKARAVLGEVTRGEIVLRPLETDPPPLEDLEEDAFPILPVALAGLAAFFVSLMGIILAILRKKNTVVATDLVAKPVVTPKKGGGLVCPKCEFEFGVGDATHCPFDDTALIALQRDARQTMFIPAAGGMVCPVCQTKYPTKSSFCGHDRSPLVPDFGQFDDDEK